MSITYILLISNKLTSSVSTGLLNMKYFCSLLIFCHISLSKRAKTSLYTTFNPARNKRFQLRINGGFLRNGLIDLAEILHAQISARCSAFLPKKLSCIMTFFDRLLQKKAWESKNFFAKFFTFVQIFRAFQSQPNRTSCCWENAVYSELESFISNWIECRQTCHLPLAKSAKSAHSPWISKTSSVTLSVSVLSQVVQK